MRGYGLGAQAADAGLHAQSLIPAPISAALKHTRQARETPQRRPGE